MAPRGFLRELGYPLRHTGLAVTTLVFAFLIQLGIAAGMFGLWLLLIVGAGGAKFLVLLLRARALGTEPPVPDIEHFNPVSSLWTLAAWLLLLAIPLVSARAAAHLGTVSGMLLLVAGLFLYPAAVLRLGVTMSPVRMLSPAGLVETVRRTGWSYLLIFAGVAIVTSLAFWAARFAGPLTALAERLASAYALVLAFSLAGAVFYDRRFELELPVIDSPERRAARAERLRERDRRAVLDHVYAHVSRGNGPAGITYLIDWLRRTEAGADAWAWFFERLWEWESPRAAINLGREYISMLCHDGQSAGALQVYRRCRQADPDFRPRDTDTPSLLSAARGLGDGSLLAALGGDRGSRQDA